MLAGKPIIVLTPIRNDDWILERFLQVTSVFADKIIIIDQMSFDRSKEICHSFDKVDYLYYNKESFDAGERRGILYDRVRELYPGDKIVLSLDCDEFLCADSLKTPSWKSFITASKGTVCFFEKPDLLPGLQEVIRYHDNYWPLAYVDDGQAYEPGRIHCKKTPMPVGAEHLKLGDVKFLHYGMVRKEALRSKHRFYSVIERDMVNKVSFKHLLRIAASYQQDFNFKNLGDVEQLPASWLQDWTNQGIDLRTIKSSEYFWYDLLILGKFAKEGCRKYWPLPIWDFNWEQYLAFAKKEYPSYDLPNKIDRPSDAYLSMTKCLSKLFNFYRKVR